MDGFDPPEEDDRGEVVLRRLLKGRAFVELFRGCDVVLLLATGRSPGEGILPFGLPSEGKRLMTTILKGRAI
jgi:hypothetical protein